MKFLGFQKINSTNLSKVSGGVFHAYTANAVRRNYRSAVKSSDWIISFARGFFA